MHELRNGEHPHNVGAAIAGSQEFRETLIDRVTEDQRSELLAEYADKEYGLLLVFEEGERESFKLEEGVAGVVYWSESIDEPDTDLRQLSQEETELLLASFESVITNRIIQYYLQHPADDTHAAYGLYDLHLHRVARAKRYLASQDRSTT